MRPSWLLLLWEALWPMISMIIPPLASHLNHHQHVLVLLSGERRQGQGQMQGEEQGTTLHGSNALLHLHANKQKEL